MKDYRARPTQRAIIGVLEESPLPWTYGMLAAWLGLNGGRAIDQAVAKGRIWRISTGLYTASKNRPAGGPRVVVTDDMIEIITGMRL